MGNTRNQYLDKNPFWKGGYTTHRRLAFEVYKLKKECFSCGSIKKICVHHIDKNRKNNSKENLQILCLICHSYLHQEGRPCSKEKREKLRIGSLGNKNSAGRIMTKEQKEIIAKANKKRIWSKKSRMKLGKSIKKRYKMFGHHNKGKPLSKERKQKYTNWYNSLSIEEKIEYANKRRRKHGN